MLYRKFIVFLSVVIIALPVSSASKKRRKSKSKVVKIKVEEAPIYQYPNFDSPIISYFKKGRKVRSARKLTPGIGGLGNFYKVKIKKGKFGYITDVDLFPDKKQDGPLSGAPEPNSSVFTPGGGAPDGNFPQAESGIEGKPIFFNRYFGLTYSMVNFTEEIAGKMNSELIGFMGLKLSGPGALFLTQLPLHLNIMGLFGPPQYYNEISDGTEGFSIISDLLLVMPFINKEKYMIYYGLGPAIIYNSYKINIKIGAAATPLTADSQVVNLGVSGVVGASLKLGNKIAVSAEGKYIYEKQGYYLFNGGIHYLF